MEFQMNPTIWRILDSTLSASTPRMEKLSGISKSSPHCQNRRRSAIMVMLLRPLRQTVSISMFSLEKAEYSSSIWMGIKSGKQVWAQKHMAGEVAPRLSCIKILLLSMPVSKAVHSLQSTKNPARKYGVLRGWNPRGTRLIWSKSMKISMNWPLVSKISCWDLIRLQVRNCGDVKLFQIICYWGSFFEGIGH